MPIADGELTRFRLLYNEKFCQVRGVVGYTYWDYSHETCYKQEDLGR